MIDTAAPEEPQPEVITQTAVPAEVCTDIDTYDFCIELQEETLPDVSRANLDRIIESKGNLLRKALGTDTLSYEIANGKVRFPWFHISGSPEEVIAYTQLVTALVEMANNSKRITAKERTVENEKTALGTYGTEGVMDTGAQGTPFC